MASDKARKALALRMMSRIVVLKWGVATGAQASVTKAGLEV